MKTTTHSGLAPEKTVSHGHFPSLEDIRNYLLRGPDGVHKHGAYPASQIHGLVDHAKQNAEADPEELHLQTGHVRLFESVEGVLKSVMRKFSIHRVPEHERTEDNQFTLHSDE